MGTIRKSPAEDLRCWNRLIDRLQVTLVGVGRLSIGPGWGHGWRDGFGADPIWRLIANDRAGASILPLGRPAIALRPEQLWIVPAWLPFQVRCTGVVDHAFLHWDVEGIPIELIQELFQDVVPLPRDPWQGLMSAAGLGVSQPQRSLAARSAQEALVHGCCAQLWEGLPAEAYRRVEASLLSPSRVDRVLAHVRRDPGQPWRVDDLAASMELSARRFSDLVKNATGLAPGRYIIRERLRLATRLLRLGTTIDQVAERCGFSDRSHFSRCFRQHFGSSPAVWLQQM